MNCIKCGAELNDGAKFCNACGAPQDAGPSKCVKCGAELKAGSRFCDACGAPQVAAQAQPPPPQAPASIPVPPGLPPRKLVTYRMLAFFLGSLGVHDFYAGYTVRGVCKLVLFLLGGLSGIWALVDIFTVTADAYGRPMEDTVPKNLLTYRLLAFFLGFTGVHNFYSGHLGLGLVKLLLGWTGISTIWAWIEMCFVKKDAKKNEMVLGPKAQKFGKDSNILSLVLSGVAILLWLVIVFTSNSYENFYIYGVDFIYKNTLFGVGVLLFVIAFLLGIVAAFCSRYLWILGVLLCAVIVGGSQQYCLVKRSSEYRRQDEERRKAAEERRKAEELRQVR